MSTVLVTGGTGALGKRIVERLRVRGHEVRVLSRREGAGTHVGDLATGEGVRAAAQGAELMVHAASDFRRSGKPDVAQTRNLLTVAGDVRQLLYVSIVGIDRIPLRYYRNKLACEELISGSPVPHTILRATQFHDLVATALRAAERLPIAPLPTDFRFQPVATEDVALRVADLVEDDPRGRAPDFGGPEVLTLAELAETWRRHRGRPRRIVRIPLPGKVAHGYRTGANLCPEHPDGVQTWAEYVAGDPEASYRLRG
ncbi:NAD(P)H-binding protein [Nocardia sp. CDC159]|uniref:NAD(P)H-binding protein n=1 Tax=Nocardia pulmonis TaxID=2951408 RepID=A0A9X2E8G7_9NOCA|nr:MULTISPECIES: NAD(P)H-binding protein [Nocardia]MCM6773398.1 NAD(P)H-binding protein [Nocardia pulmonis]MCM6786285.1 NAD(P)H-binding protein [Nocardia sp. CDC159]